MSDKAKILTEKIISRITESLQEIENDMLAEGLIKERKPIPQISVFDSQAKGYIGLIEVIQSKDGKAVECADVFLSGVHLVEVFRQNAARKMLHIMSAHLACTIHFPHDPCPGTPYWNKAMFSLGYLGGPRGIKGLKPIKCVRKKLA
jgi:hypothetical protein